MINELLKGTFDAAKFGEAVAEFDRLDGEVYSLVRPGSDFAEFDRRLTEMSRLVPSRAALVEERRLRLQYLRGSANDSLALAARLLDDEKLGTDRGLLLSIRGATLAMILSTQEREGWGANCRAAKRLVEMEGFKDPCDLAELAAACVRLQDWAAAADYQALAVGASMSGAFMDTYTRELQVKQRIYERKRDGLPDSAARPLDDIVPRK